MTSAPSLTLGPEGQLLVSGEMVFVSVNSLRQQGLNLLAGQQTATIDLAGVTRADSAGLSLMLEWLRSSRQSDKSLEFRNVPAKLMVVAELSDLDGVIPVS